MEEVGGEEEVGGMPMGFMLLRMLDRLEIVEGEGENHRRLMLKILIQDIDWECQIQD